MNGSSKSVISHRFSNLKFLTLILVHSLAQPFAEKPRQTSADYLTKYVVMFGAVSVQIGEKPTVFLKSMDSFTVDKHTPYSIRNLRKDESLLYFDVCRPN